MFMYGNKKSNINVEKLPFLNILTRKHVYASKKYTQNRKNNNNKNH